MSPIHVFATWKIKPGQLETVLSMLQELGAKSTAEKGNLFYRVHQDSSDPNTLVLFEGYANQAALTEHLNSAHYVGIVVEKIRPLLQERAVILTNEISYN